MKGARHELALDKMWDFLRREIFIDLPWQVRREGIRSHWDHAGGLLEHERDKPDKGVSWKR